jgi:DNA-binding transcriptional regulator YiaG
MAAVESALRKLIEFRSRKVVAGPLADIRREIKALAAEVAQLRKDMASAATPEGAPKPAAAEAAGPAAPAVGGVRFTKRFTTSLRKRFNLAQRELGRLVGVSGATIASWEAGKSRPRGARLECLAKLRSGTQQDVDKALGRTGAPGMDGAEIKSIRKKLGLSQAEFAKKVGVSNGSIAAWETDRSRPGPKNRAAIAAICEESAPAPEAPLAAKPEPKAKPKAAKPGLTPAQIKAIREGAGLSQAAMAKQLGVAVNSISNWENGRSKPRGASVAKLQALQS